MAASKTRVKVPKDAGDEIVVSWDGDEPTTYPVSESHISLESQHVDRFLNLFEGSSVSKNDAADSGLVK